MEQYQIGMLDGLQATVIADNNKKQNLQKNQQYYFEPLSLYFRENYEVKGIQIVQPTIGDILHIGESKFYSGLSPILNNSTSIRVMLWDKNIDWCTVKDLEVFSFLSKNVDVSAFRLLFPNVNIENFKIIFAKRNKIQTESEMALYDGKTILYEEDYMEIAEYIRTMLNIHPKVEKAKGKTAKKWMIDEDRMNAIQNKDIKNNSMLLPLISSCVNHPGFKYKLQELRNVGIYEFMDSVQRLQTYEATHALLSGMYSGFCDTSKIDKEAFNFMRDLHN